MNLSRTLSLLFLASAAAGHSNNSSIEIVGGKEATVGQHLYVTGLRYSAPSSDFCGGSLIAPTVVLTAAHCMGSDVNYVAIGTHYLSGTQDGEQIKVKQQIKHPKNVAALNTYDFAILILERASKYPPVQVSFDDVVGGTPTIVRGWGTTASGGLQSKVLKEVEVDALDNTKCNQLLSGAGVDKTMICAGGKLGEDSCQGDSGGPLTVEQNGSELLVGVVSWGEGCAKQDKPGVYARISTARDFIEPYLKNSPTATPTPATPPTPTTPKPSSGVPTPKPTSTRTPLTQPPTPTTPTPGCGTCVSCYYPSQGQCLTDFSKNDCDNFSNSFGTIWCGP
ncbi:Aste57867_8626 [Aphanomyces stellatus]|uniref:Aste57867_8626 protein n=1 Tax=Aphanomyces stellatus TaxID=120398 RepID=A0A485KL42_9STRA|nr:hypothetical protein As57867_008592 [Aphanomyces stellatus]VFT85512.1 Aste57867_8626 [Aphanomyces stellatus]